MAVAAAAAATGAAVGFGAAWMGCCEGWAPDAGGGRRRRHPSGLSARTARRLAAARGGKLHVFEALAGPRTALLVIDMQEGFLAEKHRGQPFFCPEGRGSVSNTNRVAEAVRRSGGRVFWITSDVGPDSLESWSVLYDGFIPAAHRGGIAQQLASDDGRWGADYDPWRCLHGMDGPLDPDLEVRPEDYVVKKDRFSIFAYGGGKHQGCQPADGAVGPLDFAERLRGLGVDTVLLAGVSTACCVESTARDAMQQNFKVVVLSDACAASTLQDHTTSLDHLAYLMADVRTSGDVISLLSS